MKLAKLNSRGISHIIVPLLVVIVVGAVGTYVLKASHADQLSPNSLVPPGGGSSPSASVTYAKDILANHNIGLSASARADIVATSQGKQVLPGKQEANSGLRACSSRKYVTINSTLLHAAINISSYSKIYIGTIVSGHDCDTGNHPLGRAFDIFGYNTTTARTGWNTSGAESFDIHAAAVMNSLVPNGKTGNGGNGPSPRRTQAGVGVCSATQSYIQKHTTQYKVAVYVDGNCDQTHIDVGY